MTNKNVLIPNCAGLVLCAIAIDHCRILLLYTINTPQTNHIWRTFNVETKQWTDLPTLPAHKRQVGWIRTVPKCTIFDGVLYVTIGYDGSSSLWRLCMNRECKNNTTGILAHSEENHNYSSMTCTSKWEEIDEFELGSFGFGVNSDHETHSIYISGGYRYSDDYEERIELKEMKRFSPNIENKRCTVSTASWKYLSDLPFERRDHISVRVKEKIYLFGGYGDAQMSSNPNKVGINESSGITYSRHIRSVHVFDINNDTWIFAPDIPSNMDTNGLSAEVVMDRWIVLISRKGKSVYYIFDTKIQVWFQGRGVIEDNRDIASEESSWRGIMPKHDHIKIIVLTDSNDIILVGEKCSTPENEQIPQYNRRFPTFTIKSIPFSYLHPWFAIGEFILIRNLVNAERAIPLQKLCDNEKLSKDDEHKKYRIALIQTIILNTSDDIFHAILSFLIYH